MDTKQQRLHIQRAYDEIVFQQAQTSDTPSEYLAKAIEAEISAEQLSPVSFVEGEPIENDDSVFFLNTHATASKEFTQAIIASQFPKKAESRDFWKKNIMAKNLQNVYFATMISYFSQYDGNHFLKSESAITLSEILSQNEIRQLHIASRDQLENFSTALNNGQTIIYDNQKNVAIPPHEVEIELDTQTANNEILKTIEKNCPLSDFFVAELTEFSEISTKQLLSLSETQDVDILLLEDNQQGKLRYLQQGKPTQLLKQQGTLSDIAPTILSLYKIKKSDSMTGESLLTNKN